jgi:hypothetical protein
MPGQPTRSRRPGPRHRPARRLTLHDDELDLLWPLTALLLGGLVTARTLSGHLLPDDGVLTAVAFRVTRGEAGPAPLLSPEGLGGLHTALYAAVTRSFDRHASLAAAGREMLWVLLLLSALLLWRTARRLGLGNPAAAVAVLALTASPALAQLHAVSTPAAWAVPWLLLSAFLLAPGRPSPAAGALALLASALAVLLAPETLLLLSAGLAAALAADRPGLLRARGQRAAAGVVLGLVFLGTRLALGRWDPQAAGPQGWDAGLPRLLVVCAALLVVGLLAGLLLPALRAPAVALVVTTLVAAAPPTSRPSALVLCLPVGALLLGGLVEPVAGARARAEHLRRSSGVAPATLAAALVAAVVVAAVALGRTRADDFGAADRTALIDWAAEQLPSGSRLTADPVLAAELVHAGADPAQVVSAPTVPVSTTAPAEDALQVTDGVLPDGAAEVARFGADPGMLVVDPQPGRPDAQQVARRRSLATALLANPSIGDAGEVATVLSSEQVDPRLLSLLAGMAAQFGVTVDRFPVVPEEGGRTPVRATVIASVAGAPLTADASAESRLRQWLDAQVEPYAADSVRPVEGGLLVAYRYVSDPDGEITRAGR